MHNALLMPIHDDVYQNEDGALRHIRLDVKMAEHWVVLTSSVLENDLLQYLNLCSYTE